MNQFLVRRTGAMLLVAVLLLSVSLSAAASSALGLAPLSTDTSQALSPVLRAGQLDPSQSGDLSTPQLIQAALANGKIDQDTASLYLAYALGAYEKLPPEYQSSVPWEGTLPLLYLQERLESMAPSPTRRTIEALLTGDCSTSTGTMASVHDSTHFHIEYNTIAGGLDLNDYVTSLETTWNTEITSFGWAAPPVLASNPPPGNRYHVRIDSLGSGLYGYVSPNGDHAGFVGDNPNTTWDDIDAFASCMVLNQDYSAFPGTSQQALDATTAHEFNHSIQFGYGALTGANRPDQDFVEGGATWMEDEVFDSANDNYNYLWPTFSMCMGEYTDSPYPYWITWRGVSERYGTGTPGGSEQVMQDFWEETSQSATSNILDAMNTSLVRRGTNLADAYHAYAIAVKFNKTCGGDYAYPFCFEEAANYVGAAGATAVHGTISAAGGSYTGSLADNYALNWISLPTSGGPYNVTLQNTSAGGQLRGSVVCDTGTELRIRSLPAVVGASQSTKLRNMDPTGCTSVVAVITNQSQTADNPTSCTARSYALRTSHGIAVTPAGWDDIGAVLTLMGYSWTEIADTDLNSYDNISQYDVIFANCSSAGLANGPYAADALQQFVQEGGSFYASDFAYTYISSAFPSYISFYAYAHIGSTGTVTADIVDTGLANYLDPASPPSTLELNYDLGGWVPIDTVAAATAVHLRGDIPTSTGLLSDKPLVASFTPYPSSPGRVIYTSFHNEAQQSDMERKLLEYLVLIPSTSELVEEAESVVESEGVEVRQVNINTIDPGATSPLFSYDLTASSKLVFVNNWSGSALRLTVLDPDGAVYGEVESSTPPTSIIIPGAEAGEWQFYVTGVEVPYENYPYVVAIGDENRVANSIYLPIVVRRYPLNTGFDSQFKGSASGWEPVSGVWTVDSEYYSTTGLLGKFSSASYNSEYTNFDYQARLWRYGSDTLANRILIRGTPYPLGSDNSWYNYYSFQYTRGGLFSVWKHVTGQDSVALQYWSPSAAINQGNAWNTLRVIAYNSQLYYYINGTLVWTGSDSSLTEGRVGIGMYRSLDSIGDQLFVDWATLTTLGTTGMDASLITGEPSAEQQVSNDLANAHQSGDENAYWSGE